MWETSVLRLSPIYCNEKRLNLQALEIHLLQQGSNFLPTFFLSKPATLVRIDGIVLDIWGKLRILPQQNTALLSHVCLCVRPWTGVTWAFMPIYIDFGHWCQYISCSHDQTRPDQTRPDQTRPVFFQQKKFILHHPSPSLCAGPDYKFSW